MGGAGDASALKASSAHACTTALQSIHTPLRSTDCTAESTATKPVNTAQELLSGPKETQNSKDSLTVEETQQRKSPKESRANRSAWTGFSIEELLKPSTTQGTHSVAKTTTTTTTTAAETSPQQHNAVCNEDDANKSTDATTRTNEAVTDNTGSVSSQAAAEKGKYATDAIGDNVQRIHESVTGAPMDKTVDNSRNHDSTGLTVTVNTDVVLGINSSDGNVPTSTGSAINGEKSKSSQSNSEPPKDTTDSSKNGEIVSPETRETLSLFDAVHSMLSNISGETGTSYKTPKADACETVENVSHKEGSQTCDSSEKASHSEGAESVDSAQRSSEETVGQRKMTTGSQDAETGEKVTPPSVVIPGRSYGQADFENSFTIE